MVQLAVGDDEGLGDSRPCHLCLEWLRTCGVKRVFFSVKAARHGPVTLPPPSLTASGGGPVRWMKQVRGVCARVHVSTLCTCPAIDTILMLGGGKQSVELLYAEPHYVTSAERGEARRKHQSRIRLLLLFQT